MVNQETESLSNILSFLPTKNHRHFIKLFHQIDWQFKFFSWSIFIVAINIHSTFFFFILFIVPSKPLNLTVLEVTSTTITIGWREPENLNGAIVGYRVFYIHQNQTYFATVRSGTAAGELIRYDLSDLSKYSLTMLCACNAQFNVPNIKFLIPLITSLIFPSFISIHIFRAIFRIQNHRESIHVEKWGWSIRFGDTAYRY